MMMMMMMEMMMEMTTTTMEMGMEVMESIAKEFEQEADNRWNLSRPGADDEQVEKISWKVDHCLSRRFVEFFRSHPDLSSQQSSLNASKHDGEGDKTGANLQETQDGQEGSKMIFAVFTLDELDDNIQDKDEQRDVLMVEEEIDDGGDYIALDRWSKGLKILQTDLSLWVRAVETLLLSTELGAGMTSFGQLDHDRSGLRTVCRLESVLLLSHVERRCSQQAGRRAISRQAGRQASAGKQRHRVRGSRQGRSAGQAYDCAAVLTAISAQPGARTQRRILARLCRVRSDHLVQGLEVFSAPPDPLSGTDGVETGREIGGGHDLRHGQRRSDAQRGEVEGDGRSARV
eukprot:763876-Hanusia_phi.AAC.1